MVGKNIQQTGMEEASENSKESSHSAQVNRMSECEVCFASKHITNFAWIFWGHSSKPKSHPQTH